MKELNLQSHSPALRYGFALAMVAVSILSRFALMPILGPGYQYVTVFPLIVVVAILAGRGPAILHAVVSGPLATYFFTTVMDIQPMVGALIVILTGLLAGYLAQRLHDALRQSRQRSEALAQSQEKLKAKNQELETIISIVSHDLRAPLVNVKGFSSEIASDNQLLTKLVSGAPLDLASRKQVEAILLQNIPESVKFIQASAEAMNNLVVALVEVARAGLVPVKPRHLDMNELVKKVLDSITIKFKSANVAYDFQQLPPCHADPLHVSQVFTNLLDNAVKYLDASRPGQICIGGAIQAGGVLYWVSDNGIGISLEDQEKIFEPYHQLHEKAAGGFGVGLDTVQRMVDRNNGKIWVISEKGKGSTFYVVLPSAPVNESITAQ